MDGMGFLGLLGKLWTGDLIGKAEMAGRSFLE